jgi:hypothetical protein
MLLRRGIISSGKLDAGGAPPAIPTADLILNITGDGGYSDLSPAARSVTNGGTVINSSDPAINNHDSFTFVTGDIAIGLMGSDSTDAW